MDIGRVRKDFSLLDNRVFYFNNASTLLKPDCVIKALENFCLSQNAVFVGNYQNSDLVNEKIYECRKLVAELIRCEAEEVIFTSNCTDSLDRLAQIVGVGEGDNVVCSILDHNANLIPWKKRGANIFLLNTLKNGALDLRELEEILKNNKIKFVSLPALSNTSGNIQPFEEMVEIAHRYDVQICVDFAQYVPHLPVDFKKTNCDFCCFSAHKIGSSCFGVLVGKKNVLEQYREKNYVKNVLEFFSEYKIPLKPIPSCFEFGSLQFFDIVVFSSAMRYYLSLGYDVIRAREEKLKNYFLKKSEKVECVKFLFPVQKMYVPIFTFSFTNENVDLVEANRVLLEKYKIVLSCSTQCAQPLYRQCGEEVGLRASCAFYNTEEEIDYLFDKLKIVSEMF